MTEGPAPERPQGTPGLRALGAMESAVRRVRESAGEPPLPSNTVVRQAPERPGRAEPEPGPDRSSVPPGLAHAPVVEGSPPLRASEDAPRWWDRQGERWLVGAVVAAAILVVAAAIALAASLSGSGSAPPSPATVAAPAAIAHNHGHGGNPSGHRGGTPSAPPSTSATSTPAATASTTSTTTSTPLAAPGAAPVIAALSPASGGPGQAIQVAGANFLSTNGQIVATFNGQVAPTSCPAQNTCTITAPQMSGSSSAQVVISTASGSSNPVTFTYS